MVPVANSLASAQATTRRWPFRNSTVLFHQKNLIVAHAKSQPWLDTLRPRSTLRRALARGELIWECHSRTLYVPSRWNFGMERKYWLNGEISVRPHKPSTDGSCNAPLPSSSMLRRRRRLSQWDVMLVELDELHRVRITKSTTIQSRRGIFSQSGRRLMMGLIAGKQFGVSRARWPVKSAEFLLGLLKNAEANADTKGLDTGNLVVKHIQVNQAPKQRRRTYRAHGRVRTSRQKGWKEWFANEHLDQPIHVQPMPHRVDFDWGWGGRSEVRGCWGSWASTLELKTTWCSSTPCYHRCINGCFLWFGARMGFLMTDGVIIEDASYGMICTSVAYLLVTKEKKWFIKAHTTLWVRIVCFIFRNFPLSIHLDGESYGVGTYCITSR